MCARWDFLPSTELLVLPGTKSIQYNANVMEIASCPQAEGKGADFGRQFTASWLRKEISLIESNTRAPHAAAREFCALSVAGRPRGLR